MNKVEVGKSKEVEVEKVKIYVGLVITQCMTFMGTGALHYDPESAFVALHSSNWEGIKKVIEVEIDAEEFK